MEQIDQLWAHLSKLQKDNPISYHETIEKLKKEHEKTDVEKSKNPTKLVAFIKCKAEKLGDVFNKFVIKVCSNEKCPFPESDIEPIRLCLAYEKVTNCMLIIANPKILKEVISKGLKTDFLRGVAPFVFGETQYKLTELKLVWWFDVSDGCTEETVVLRPKHEVDNDDDLGLKNAAKGEKVKDGDLTKNLPKMDADEKLKLDDELKDSLTNVNIFEKLTEITGDKIHVQEGQKYKPDTDNSKNCPDVLIHEKVAELGIVESNKNKLTWIDDFTAKLDLQGHPNAHGVEIECEMDKITVLTSSPTNLCFVEKLKKLLTTDQVDRVKVKFKKKGQFLLISFPEN